MPYVRRKAEDGFPEEIKVLEEEEGGKYTNNYINFKIT